MKVIVPQATLQSALSLLQRSIPSKPSMPILSSILMSVEDQTVTLSSTDLYLGMQTTLSCQVDEPGVIAIPGKIFIETISQLGAGPITLTSQATELLIESSSGKTKLAIQAADDFPAFPSLDGISFELPIQILDQVLSLVAFSVSNDVTRPILTSLYWNISPEGIEVVGTDGFRLSIFASTAFTSSETQKLLIPARGLQEVGKVAHAAKVESVKVTISPELKQIGFECEGTQIFVRLLEGEYPPYQKIVPSSFTCQIEFDTEEMMAHLKRALIFARESSNIVKWEISGDKCLIKASSATIGTHEGEIAVVNTDGTSGEIAFNAKYVLEYLMAAKSQRMWFGMAESLKPALFRPLDLAESRYVVMPFRVQS